MRLEDRQAHLLSAFLRLSVLYDYLALALLLWMPDWLLRLFAHPVPADPFLFRLAALPLFLLPVVYGMASVDPVGRSKLTQASIRLRLLGALGILLLIWWQEPPAPWAYLCFAAGDLLWGILYILPARRYGIVF